MGKKLDFSIIKKAFKNKGYILLSSEKDYENCDSKLRYICKKHGEQIISYDKLRIGQGCKFCGYDKLANERKIDFKKVKEYFKGRNYVLLSNESEYKNNLSKLRFVCPKHGEQLITFASLKKGSGCNLCGIESTKEKQKLDYNLVKEIFEKNQYILLSKNYINAHSKLSFVCMKHQEKGVQLITYNRIKSGSGCSYCGLERTKNKLKHEFEYVKKKFDERNYLLLENDYINSQTKMRYICLKHDKYVQEITFNRLIRGGGCKYCFKEKVGNIKRHSIEVVKNIFSNKGLILLGDNYTNNETKMKYICLKHPNLIQETSLINVISSKYSCPLCYSDNKKGEKSTRWKGGITPLHQYLRGYIIDWKKESIIYGNYKCAITGDKFGIIHHLYPFSKIIVETLNELNFPLYEQINLYSDYELESIKQKCLHLHYKYGYGILLRSDIHDLFHQIYTKNNNTPQQFEEFVQRYYNGEFKEAVSASFFI